MLTNETSNYIEKAAKVKKILGRDIFFGLEIGPDPKNKSRNVIYLDIPDQSSPFPRYVSSYSRILIYRFYSIIYCYLINSYSIVQYNLYFK